ncbi:MAG TPA: UDP-N-acetylmuramate--L-alanine ligase [Candidatus Sulfotelmatobacter sp.]|nr:UDP-N-acetylmuramate--L-alanine ligase [Candidatus Sulfotelmatobacter sp.]
MKKIKNIHFVGIKGVGMTPLAIIAKEAGFKVTGCDVNKEFITDESLKKAGIVVQVGFDAAHVKESDLVITTGAHGGFDNIENIEAKNKNVPVWTQGEAVGKFMDGEIFGRKFKGISISGSHGKTTTTAMIATILMVNGMDPSFLIGTGSVSSLGSSGHFGKGEYFVAEADEYSTEPKYDKTPKLLWQKPLNGVITNIEFDHPDVYLSLEDLKNAFEKFSNNIKDEGALIACFDDKETKDIIKNYKKRIITYGFSSASDFYIKKYSLEEDRAYFWVSAKNTLIGQFILNVIGEHNILNALCSIVVCLELGISADKIKKGLLEFKGSKRRMEYKGRMSSGAAFYDDYAHHPTEIKKTLEGVKKSFPSKKIVCIFQPHTYSRTKSLLEQFISSFSSADEIIFTDIYSSLREEKDSSISSKILSDEVSKLKKNVTYIAKLEDVVKYLVQNSYNEKYIIITTGAGDVYQVAEDALKWKNL